VAALCKAWVCGRSLGLLVRIPPGHGCLSLVSVVLSGRGLCDGLITRPEESYRLWCLECDHDSSIMKRACPTGAVAPW
jgi:hypothetical protein